QLDHRRGPRTGRGYRCASLDRAPGDDWAATTIHVEGDAHAPQLFDLSALATEASQLDEFIGIEKHRWACLSPPNEDRAHSVHDASDACTVCAVSRVCARARAYAINRKRRQKRHKRHGWRNLSPWKQRPTMVFSLLSPSPTR